MLESLTAFLETLFLVDLVKKALYMIEAKIEGNFYLTSEDGKHNEWIIEHEWQIHSFTHAFSLTPLLTCKLFPHIYIAIAKFDIQCSWLW